MKNILQRETKKETRKYSTSTYLTVLSNRIVKKESGVVDAGGKKWIYMFKAKERKQYEKNGTENLFVVIMYLIEEAFKTRLL